MILNAMLYEVLSYEQEAFKRVLIFISQTFSGTNLMKQDVLTRYLHINKSDGMCKESKAQF